MDQGADDIQQSITATRQDIEETRAAMTEKLELLEERVRETVENAKSTVEDIMENVKGTVDETVGAVKETVGDARSTVEGIVENVKDTMDDTVTMVKQSVDLQYQMDQHPWMMLSGSVLVGYWLGCLGTRGAASSSYSRRHSSTGAEAFSHGGYYPVAADIQSYNQAAATSWTPTSGLWSSTLGQFREEFDMIKGAVIGALMSNLRDMIKESIPRIAPQLEKAINSATTKLGAQPLDDAEPKREDPDHYEEARSASGTKASNPSSASASKRRGQIAL